MRFSKALWVMAIKVPLSKLFAKKSVTCWQRPLQLYGRLDSKSTKKQRSYVEMIGLLQWHHKSRGLYTFIEMQKYGRCFQTMIRFHILPKCARLFHLWCLKSCTSIVISAPTFWTISIVEAYNYRYPIKLILKIPEQRISMDCWSASQFLWIYQ